MLINTKNLNENKEIVVEIEDRISDLKDRIKKNWVKQKKKVDQTLNITEEIFDDNERIQQNFLLASKDDKRESGPEDETGKSELKPEESIAKKSTFNKRMCS